MKKCGVCKQIRQIIVKCPMCQVWFCGLCTEHHEPSELKNIDRIKRKTKTKKPVDKTEGDL